ncbi:MAG: 1,4-dihydroxy-2-naphthoate polyprenyltransferase [Acidobacteria bacterium]|nr:1,4-dihydroxy-2-naphthoate polyprenyltransferase [Acidobacteriota bacterium]
MNRARALVVAARLRTLPAAASPVIVGLAIAWAAGQFRVLPAVATMLFSLLIQVGTNYTNDVLDFERGTDTADRVGPLRVTQAGLLTPRAVKLAAAGAFGAAALIAVYLAFVGGWPVVAIGVVSIACGVAYTGGPWPLAHHGLADLFVMAFFGFVAVCGTVFIQLGHIPPLAWACSLPIGALATAILVVNNTRDLATDRIAGRRTVPVVLGRRAGVVEYAALLAAAYATPAAIVAAGLAGPWTLLTLVTLPWGVGLARTLARTEGPALNATLAGTAKLLLVFALLLAAGLVVPGRP